MTKKKASKKEDYSKRVRVNDGTVDLYNGRVFCYLREEWNYVDVCKLLKENTGEVVDWFDDTSYLEVVVDEEKYYIPLEE